MRRQTHSQTIDSDTSRVNAQLYIHSTIIIRTGGEKRNEKCQLFYVFSYAYIIKSTVWSKYILILKDLIMKNFSLILLILIWIENRFVIVLGNLILYLDRTLNNKLASFNYSLPIRWIHLMFYYHQCLYLTQGRIFMYIFYYSDTCQFFLLGCYMQTQMFII